jgi:hypothetical protein
MCSHYAGSLPETSECRDRRRLSRDRNLGQTPSAPTGLAAATLLFLILCYRRYVSPYTVPSCRFTPTCSRYATVNPMFLNGFLCASVSLWL